jgi:hypothetical protein
MVVFNVIHFCITKCYHFCIAKCYTFLLSIKTKINRSMTQTQNINNFKKNNYLQNVW